MENKSQKLMILQHLKKFGRITQREAYSNYGCFRLGARIWELKQEGKNINRRTVRSGRKNFAEYYLEQA